VYITCNFFVRLVYALYCDALLKKLSSINHSSYDPPISALIRSLPAGPIYYTNGPDMA